MRYLSFNDNLFLIEKNIPQSSNKNIINDVTNHIFIYDRSYSMFNELKKLGSDLIERIKQLPTGDTVTLGWFSGKGRFNFILKGFKVNDSRDFKILEDTIRENLKPIGLTCFSEVLEETYQIVKDLSPISKLFSLTFFTDGYPVVPDYYKEIDSIENAIKRVEGDIAASLFVGYGNYYNKNLMSKMASDMGGSLVHCGSLLECRAALEGFIESVSESNPKMEIEVGDKSELVFNISKQSINSYAVKDRGTILFTPNKKGRSSIFILSKSRPAKAEEIEISQTTLSDRDPLIKAAYAASYLLTQRSKSDVALEILGCLGDKALIDSISNAFTIEEYGKAENKIKRAVTHPTYGRFTEGRDTNYLPAKDAFCVLDVLDILLADKESYFLPYHEEFKYRRIGPSAKQKDEYPKFHPDLNAECSFSSLVWNKSKLNLSVLARIKGNVEFKEGYAAHGFQKYFPSFVYRNYTIIKDGILNINKIPVKLSASTKKILAKKNILEDSGSTDIICLGKLPVINQIIAEGNTSAKSMCKAALEEINLQAELKALKYKRDEIEPKKDSLKNELFTKEQVDFLATKGIGKNGFSPQMEKPDYTDYYYAKEFQVKIKGLSSLPSIKSVKEKVEQGKNLTASAALVQKGLSIFNGQGKAKKIQLSEIDTMIEERQSKLLKLRQEMQRTKFAILLASKWFDEFESRKDCQMTVDGNHFTFGIREVKINV